MGTPVQDSVISAFIVSSVGLEESKEDPHPVFLLCRNETQTFN